MDSMASRICFGTMGWMSIGERQEKKDGREEIAREGESGGGRRKVRRVEGREKGEEPGKDEDETCLEK